MASDEITEAMIKAVTGAFDTESVTRLQINGVGLRRIANVRLCPNLVRLDLSNNAVERVAGLEELVVLQHLDLSRNRIARISGVVGMEALETLLLHGNAIRDVDEVVGLQGLPALVTLWLQDAVAPAGQRLHNPACEHPSYFQVVTRHLPKLKCLDGERLGMKDSVQQAMLRGVHPDEEVDVPASKPWLGQDYRWGDEDVGGGGFKAAVATAAGPMLDALAECDDLVAKADEAITSAQGGLAR